MSRLYCARDLGQPLSLGSLVAQTMRVLQASAGSHESSSLGHGSPSFCVVHVEVPASRSVRQTGSPQVEYQVPLAQARSVHATPLLEQLQELQPSVDGN